MSQPPGKPKLYHITLAENLPGMIQAGGLWSDAERIRRKLDTRLIGMSGIKLRRLEELTVDCHPDTKVGEYVPFYFCPRSVMLFILHRGNHPDIDYRGGQGNIVHLRADLHATVAWAKANRQRWAFSDRNAGAYIADFFARLDQLDRINWEAVNSADFRSPTVKEGKQAEFLLHGFFPWTLIEGIGVHNQSMADTVVRHCRAAEHRPPVAIKSSWYY